MTLEEIKTQLQLATQEKSKRNFAHSIALSEEVQKSIIISESTELNFVEQYIEALLIQGWSLFSLGNIELCLSKCSEVLFISKKYSLTTFIAKAKVIIGNVNFSQSDFHIALENYLEALSIFKENEDKINISKTTNSIGRVYSSLSDFDNALEFYSIALKLFEEIGDQIGIGGSFNNIGLIYDAFCNYDIALEYFAKALVIFEELGNKEFQATISNNIGNVYLSLSEFDSALEYFGKSLFLSKEIGYKRGIAFAVGNIGIVNSKIKNYEMALEYYFEALKINQEIGNKLGIASAYNNIGNDYNASTFYEKAFEFYSKALEIHELVGDKRGIAIVEGNIGNVFANIDSKLFDATKAEEHLNKSLSISKEIGDKERMKEAFENLYKLRLNEERFKEAIDFLLKSIQLEKEIFNVETKKQADRFELERKSAEREKQHAIERTRFQEQEKLLHNILPVNIADRILQQENFIADHFESVSVLFMDLVGFTPLSSIAPPKHLVYLLDSIFQKVDEVIESFGLEKVKTIGDGYLAVANVTSPLEHHQKATALAALHLLETMRDFVVNIPSDLGDTDWTKSINDIEIRIGIHSGEVVAGIIGKNKYTYDLWGDAVNVASRMESYSEAGRIHISEAFAKAIESNPMFKLIPRGEINIKGKGTMNTFWLEKGDKQM